MYLTKNSMEAAGMALDKEKLLEALQEIGTDDSLGVDIGTTMKLMGLDNPAKDIPTGILDDFNVNQAPIPNDWIIEPEDEAPVKATGKISKKKKDAVDEDKPKTKTFKADTMINGFMLQSNPLAEGSEPFYMEAYLLGKDEFYIAGGMSGTLNLEEMKALRKKIKFLLNQMKESYPEAEDGEKKGGKAVLKINAPWTSSTVQFNIIKQLVEKALAKHEGEVISDGFLEVTANTVAEVVSQILYEQHDENTLIPGPMTEVNVGNKANVTEQAIKD